MRKSSQVIMGALSLGAVVTGWEMGASAQTNNFTAFPTTTDTPAPIDTGTSTPTPSQTSTGQPSTTPTPQPTKTTKSPSATPTPTQSQSSSGGQTDTTVSHTSQVVWYRFGSVQLTVTKTGSKITDITMDQAGATNGRGAAFPYLIQLALDAQSSTFDTSMMTGATYTTDAFMQALGDAMSQF